MNVFQERGITHLDLHGVRHHEVKDDVIDFCYQHQGDIPLIIICGNSVNMIKIVSQSSWWGSNWILFSKIWYYQDRKNI